MWILFQGCISKMQLAYIQTVYAIQYMYLLVKVPDGAAEEAVWGGPSQWCESHQRKPFWPRQVMIVMVEHDDDCWEEDDDCEDEPGLPESSPAFNLRLGLCSPSARNSWGFDFLFMNLFVNEYVSISQTTVFCSVLKSYLPLLAQSKMFVPFFLVVFVSF